MEQILKKLQELQNNTVKHIISILTDLLELDALNDKDTCSVKSIKECINYIKHIFLEEE